MSDSQDRDTSSEPRPDPVPPHSPQDQQGPTHPEPSPDPQGTPTESGNPPGPQGGYAPTASKPGVIPLRPLGVGEILDGAISYIRANPAATLGLAAIVITISQLIQLPLVGPAANQGAVPTPVPGEQGAPSNMTGAFTSSVLAGGVAALVSFVTTTVLSGLLITVLNQAVMGRKMRIGEAWAAVRSRIPGLLGLTLLVALLLSLLVGVGIIPLVLFVFLNAGAAVSVIVGGLFMLVSFGVALYLGISWSLAAPAYVLEGIPVTAVLRRSFRLVRTQWWRVFGIVLLGGLIALIISGILAVPFNFASSAVGGAGFLGLVVSSIGAIVAATVTAPFSAGISGLLYFDQRIRREALDIELARAAQQ